MSSGLIDSSTVSAEVQPTASRSRPFTDSDSPQNSIALIDDYICDPPLSVPTGGDLYRLPEHPYGVLIHREKAALCSVLIEFQ